jgi:hypothetical protein
VTNGIQLDVIWFDQDMIEVMATCSNGYFSGISEIYLGHDGLAKLADALNGFPSSLADTRTFEIGTFNPDHADGGLRLRLSCTDASGHAVAEVKLRGCGCKGLGEAGSVALLIKVEPAAIDSFVDQLKQISASIGVSALLPMAK